jgi:hypothetical protein
MTSPTSETDALPLFNHTARKDWGVAVLVRQEGGKRGYLFEDGEERTMANGYHQLMRRVEKPSESQRAFYERQRALIARRESGSSSFLDQLEKLHEMYPAGLADPAWLVDVRGEGVEGRLARHRDALIRDAQEQLSLAAIDALIKTQNYAQIWSSVISVLSHTDLVPAAQLKKAKPASNDGLRAVALAARELLHGSGAYEPRFDAYLAALTPIYGEAPHWEIATALSAVVHPDEHVCVLPPAFKQQLKAMAASASVSARATSAGYRRFLSIARLVSNKLKEQNQQTRDLLDVYDFVRITLAPVAKVKAPSSKARKSTAPKAESKAEA